METKKIPGNPLRTLRTAGRHWRGSTKGTKRHLGERGGACSPGGSDLDRGRFGGGRGPGDQLVYLHFLDVPLLPVAQGLQLLQQRPPLLAQSVGLGFGLKRRGLELVRLLLQPIKLIPGRSQVTGPIQAVTLGTFLRKRRNHAQDRRVGGDTMCARAHSKNTFVRNPISAAVATEGTALSANPRHDILRMIVFGTQTQGGES